MAMILERASKQWAERPADQRYPSLIALHSAVTAHHERAAVAKVPFLSLRTAAVGDRVVLNGETKNADMTHWAFGQLAQRAGAPASYLRTLPAKLASDCINDGLVTNRSGEDGDDASILFDQDQGENLLVRAITTPVYKRVWNTDITSRLLRLSENGPWQPAPAAFDGSRGLYASNQDMFAFMVDNDRRIFESMPGGGLSRGFFVWNSEVGAQAFGLSAFWYAYICGNHLVWGAKHVVEIRLRHVGMADSKAFAAIVTQLKDYAEASSRPDEEKMRHAMVYRLGDDKEQVLDTIFGLKLDGLSRKLATESYERATMREDRYGDPRTVWAVANGMTELSQDKANASDRLALDRTAGKLMEIAF